MTQEIIQRLKNIYELVPEEEVKLELSKFSEKMRRSGHGEGFRRMVMLAGIKDEGNYLYIG